MGERFPKGFQIGMVKGKRDRGQENNPAAGQAKSRAKTSHLHAAISTGSRVKSQAESKLVALLPLNVALIVAVTPQSP
jgi:hypothetical protein